MEKEVVQSGAGLRAYLGDVAEPAPGDGPDTAEDGHGENEALPVVLTLECPAEGLLHRILLKHNQNKGTLRDEC